MIVRASREYFSDQEVKCKCCGIVKLNPVFDTMLFELRDAFGKPMKTNSCCRCEKRNTAVGGNPHSFHVFDKPYYKTDGTCAIDIARRDKEYNDELVRLAWKKGWAIGINPVFIHFDCRKFVTSLPQTVFSYGTTSKSDLKHFKDLVRQ